MATLFMTVGLLGGIACIVLLIVSVIKKKAKKPFVIGLAACFALMLVGGALSPDQDEQPDNKTAMSSSETETESGENEEVKKEEEEKAEKQKDSNESNPDLALIVVPGHPKYYGSTQVAHSVWDNADGNKVVFADSFNSYSDDTIINMDGYSKDEDNQVIRNIEIYFENFSNPMTFSLDDALEIASEYFPEDIVNKYYKFNGSECLKPENNDGDDDTYYHVSYCLTDSGSESYQSNEHTYSGSIDFVFVGDKDKIKYFTIGFGTPRWMSSASSNGYETVGWDYDFLVKE